MRTPSATPSPVVTPTFPNTDQQLTPPVSAAPRDAGLAADVLPATVPRFLSIAMGRESTTAATSWAQLPSHLNGPAVFRSPSGGAAAGFTMLGAPGVPAMRFDNGAAYLAGEYVVLQHVEAAQGSPAGAMKESIVVPAHLGLRTWRWRLTTVGTTPKLRTDGAVDLGNGLVIPTPFVTDVNGTVILASTRWKLDGDVLSLTVDDTMLPTPYVIDPGLAPDIGLIGFVETTPYAYIDPAYSLTRIFYNSNQSASFKVQVNASDPENDPLTVNFPALGAGWTGGGAGTNLGSTPGLLGTYYDNSCGGGRMPGTVGTCPNDTTGVCVPGGDGLPHPNFTGQSFSRIDPVSPATNPVDQTNSATAYTPYTQLGCESFSIIWTGQINVGTAGNYFFQTWSDDGIRVEVDGTEAVSDWNDHGPHWATQCNPGMALTAGWHNIKVQFYEWGGGSVWQLRWRKSGAGATPAAGCTVDTVEPGLTNYSSVGAFQGGAIVAANQFPLVNGTTDTRSPGSVYEMNYTWTANPADPAAAVTANDGTTTSTSQTFDPVPDGAGPTGHTTNQPGSPAGTIQSTTAAVAVTYNFTAASDGVAGAVSGIPAAPVQELRRISTTFNTSNNTCGAWPAWSASTLIASALPASGTVNDNTITTDACYRWAAVTYDNVGNAGYAWDGDTLKIDATAPTASLALVPNANPQYQYVTGTQVFYNSNQTGSFDVNVTAADTGSGMQNVLFPALGGTWAPAGTFTDAAAPYTRTYTWVAASASPGAQNAVARDVGNLTTNAGFTVTADGAAPTGGSITYPAVSQGTPGITLTYNQGTDGAGSGIVQAKTLIQYDTSPLVAGACTGFLNAWSTVVLGPASPTTQAWTMPTIDTCYRFRMTVTDQVGNTTAPYTSGNVVMYENTPPTATFSSWVEASTAMYAQPATNILWFQPTNAIGVSAMLRISATDTQAMSRVDFPTLTNWSAPSPASDTVPVGTLYDTNYVPAAGAVSGTFTATAYDAAGNSSTAAFQVQSDATAPTGMTATPPGGINGTGTVAVALSGSSDAQSGLGGGWRLLAESTTYQNDVCGAVWSAPAMVASGAGAPPATTNHAGAASGCYRYTLEATDNVGNTAQGTASATQKVDTVAPTATWTTPAAAAVISGTAVSLSGASTEAESGVASAAVTWLKTSAPSNGASGPACTAVVAGGPTSWTWSCPWNTTTTGAGDGTYTLTITVTDRQGHATTATRNVTVDNSPPAATFVSWTEASAWLYWQSPLNRLWFNPTSGVGAAGTLRISATDAGGVNRVDFPTLGGWTGPTPATVTVPIAPSYYDTQYTVGGASVSATVNATATDNGGNASTAAFEVKADPNLPTGMSATPPGGRITGTTAVITLAGGTDADSGIASWQLYSESTTYSNDVCGAVWNAPVLVAGTAGAAPATTTHTGLTSGCYRYTLKITDNVGNVGSSAVSASQKVDQVDPTVAWTTPANLATVAGAAVPLSGTAVEAESGPASIVVTWAKTSAPSSGATGPACTAAIAGGPTNWTWSCAWDSTATGAGDGTYTLTATITDRAGRTTVATRNISTDNLPPNATFYQWTEASPWLYAQVPTNRLWFNPTSGIGASAQLTISATDGGAVQRVDFPTLGGWTGPTPASDTTATAPSYYDTSYTVGAGSVSGIFNATAYDLGANSSTAAFEVKGDPNVPTNLVATPPGGRLTTTTATIGLSVPSDPDSGVQKWRLLADSTTYQNDVCGTTWTALPVVASGGGMPPATALHTGLASGCYRYSLEVTDNVGNVGLGAVSASQKVDLGTPTGTWTAPAAAAWVAGAAVPLAGTADDLESGVSTVTVAWQKTSAPFSGNTGAACATTTLAGGPTSWTWNCSFNSTTTGAGDGSYTLTATITDRAGKTATITRNVTVDNVPPSAAFSTWVEASAYLYNAGPSTLLWYNPAAAAYGATATLRIAASDGAGMDRVDFPTLGGWGGPAPASSNTPSAGLYDTVYTLSAGASAGTFNATAWDLAGNSATASFSTQADATAPSGMTANGPGGIVTATNVAVTLGAATETGSGIASWRLLMQSTTYQNDTCGAVWSAPSVVTTGIGAPPASATHTGVTSGCYRYSLEVTDNVNNIGASAYGANQRVDQGNPSGTWTTPALGSVISGAASPLAGTGDDGESGVASVAVTWSKTGAPSIGMTGVACASTTLAGGPTSWTWNCSWNTTATGAGDGTYLLTATVTDKAGKTATTTRSVSLDNNPPTISFVSWANPSSSPYVFPDNAGKRLWYNPVNPGGIAATLTMNAIDAGGMNDVTFPTPAGWPAPTPNPVPGAGPTYATTYTVNNGLADPPTQQATAHDLGANPSTQSFEIDADSAGPTGQSATIPTATIATTLTGFTATVDKGADAQSGLREFGLQYQYAPYINDTCGAWNGTWTDLDVDPGTPGTQVYKAVPATQTFTVTPPITSTTSICVEVRSRVRDNVNNETFSAVSGAEKFDLEDPFVDIGAPAAGANLSGTATISGTAWEQVDVTHNGGAGMQSVTVTYDGPTPNGTPDGTICTVAVTGNSAPYSCPWNTVAPVKPDGTYRLRAQSTDKSGRVSTLYTVDVLLDNQAPTAAFNSYVETSNYIHWPGGASNKLWYNPGAPAGTYSFDAVVTAFDAGSGVASVQYPSLGLGWTPGVPTNGTGPTGTPAPNSYALTYTFNTSGAITDPPVSNAVAKDGANNATNVALDIDADTTAPAGGLVNYANGYNGSTSIALTLAGGTDAQSGMGTWEVWRESSPLSGGACPSWSGMAPLGTPGSSGTGTPPATFTDTTLADANCYRYRLVVRDNVYNTTSYNNANVVLLDLTPPTYTSFALSEDPATTQYTYLASPTSIFVSQANAWNFFAEVIAPTAPSGIQNVAFSGYAGVTTSPGSATSSPWKATYSRSATPTGGAGSAAIKSGANFVTSVPFTMTVDGAVPTGGTLTYTNGDFTGTNDNVNFTQASDGAGSGLAGGQLQVAIATFANGNNTCSAFGAFVDVAGGAVTPGSGPWATSQPLADATCYMWRVAWTDNVGNVGYTVSANVLKVDRTGADTAAVTVAPVTGSYVPPGPGNVVYYNPNAAGSFTATATVADTQSGVKNVDFPAINTPSWTPAGLTTDATSPYTQTYSWVTGALQPGGPTNVVVRNNALLTVNAPFTVISDGAPPAAGGSIAYGAGYNTSGGPWTISVTDGAGDAGSGIKKRYIERREATFSGATCGAYPASGAGSWAQVGPDNPAPSWADASQVQPKCYQYRYVEEDNVGNKTFSYQPSAASPDVVIRIDDIWPPQPFTVVDPAAATQPAITTGGADPTCAQEPTYSTATPSLQWNATTDLESSLAGYKVYINASATQPATPTATYGAGATSHTVSPALAEGAHYWGVGAYDAYGNTQNSGPDFLHKFRTDAVAPVITPARTPANNAYVNTSTPAFTWTATDANCVARVGITIDGVGAPYTAVAGGAETTWTAGTPLSEGMHTWTLEAHDGAGHVTTSTTWNVGVDTLPPAAFDIVTPVDGTTVRNFIPVTWNASSDLGSGVKEYQVWAKLGAAGAWTKKVTVGPAVFNATVSGATPGTWYVRVVAVDNVGRTTNSLSDRMVISYGAMPAPTLLFPATNSYTNTLPALQWTWPSDGGPAPTDYDVFLGPPAAQVQINTGFAYATGTMTYGPLVEPADLNGDGVYDWHVMQHDPYTAGVSSVNWRFTLDRVPPNNSAALSRVATTVSWPSVPYTLAPTTKIEFWIDDGVNPPYVKATLAAAATSYNYGALPDGTYQMWTRAFDKAGNTMDSPHLTVVNDTVPPVAFNLNAPVNPALPAITNGAAAPSCANDPTFATGTPNFTWTASSDPMPGTGLAGYDVYVDAATPLGSVAAPTTTYTPGSALTSGAHNWWVVASDNFGLTTNSTPKPLLVRIDKAAPAVTLTAPLGNVWTSDNTPALTWSSSDDNCLARAAVYLDGSASPAEVLPGNFTGWAPTTALADGAHTWRVDVIDTAGNVTSSTTGAFRIDSTAPTAVTAINPADTGTIPEGMLSFDWSDASDGAGSGVATYDLWLDEPGPGGWVETGLPSSAAAIAHAIHAGAHSWKVRAIDQVGNAAVFTFTFTANAVPDTTPPNPFNLLTPANGATVPVGTPLTWESAYDFNGVANYRVFIDGGLVGTTPGNVTTFTPNAGSGSPLCTGDFDPSYDIAGCAYSWQYSAPNPFTVSPHGVNNSGGNAIGFDSYDPAQCATACASGGTPQGSMVYAKFSVDVPAGGADLRFEHHYDFHATLDGAGKITSAWDGATVQILPPGAADTPANWKSTCLIGAKAQYGTSLTCDYEVVEAANGYDSILSAGNLNPLQYRNAFSGTSSGMKQTKMRLSQWAGQTVKVRFVAGFDSCHYAVAAQYGPYCPAGYTKKGTWDIDNVTLATPALTAGAHSWYVQALDPFGNARTSNQTWSFTL